MPDGSAVPPGYCFVQHLHFFDDETGEPESELAPISRIRPRQPCYDEARLDDYSSSDHVDISVSDLWWQARR